MLQQLIAKLYLDSKDKWRVKFDTTKPHEKGDFVPAVICTAFNREEHDQKSCGVTKTNGLITSIKIGEKLFSNRTSYPVALKQDQGKPISSQKIYPSFSSTKTITSDTNFVNSSQDPVAIDYKKTCKQVAWQCAVQGALLGKDYKNSAKSLSIMIRHNGLGASLVFIGRQKKETAHYRMHFMHISEWLVTLEPDIAEGEIVKNFQTKLNSAKTRALTIGVITFLGWLSRFAEGLTIDNNSKKYG